MPISSFVCRTNQHAIYAPNMDVIEAQWAEIDFDGTSYPTYHKVVDWATIAVKYDELPKMKRHARLEAVLGISLHFWLSAFNFGPLSWYATN